MTASLLAAAALLAAISPQVPLTVDEAVRKALAEGPALRAARHAARVAQVEVDRDKPVAHPSLTATAQATLQGPRVTFPRVGDGDATVLPERYGKVELNLDQPLYRAGLGAARSLYGARTDATALDFARQQNDAILEARRAFYNLLTARAMAEVARQGADLARKHLELTRTMLQAGTASDRDVKVSEADALSAEQGALKAENGVALARGDLNRLMGREPRTDLDAAAAPTAPAVPASPEAGTAMALTRRPEVRLVEANLAAARAGAVLAGTQDQPALAARATVAHQTETAFTRSSYYAVGLVLTWSILDSGKTRADVREARERAAQLEEQLKATRLGISLEVDKAWRSMGEARQRIDAAEKEVAAAQAAFDVSELRYQTRMATQLEVSAALVGVTRAEADRAQALYDLHTAAAEYAHATGQDLPEAPVRP